MKRGLVLGKFHPLHIGHIGLFEFALKQCDELIILVCASDKECISGHVRLDWIQQHYLQNKSVVPTLLNYNENELPNTSISSKEVSRIWSVKIQNLLPSIHKVFSSETYGDYLAENLNCEHVVYDKERSKQLISASKIMQDSFNNWNSIADTAKPYFVQKVCIYGTESTGKSTLTEKLANYYNTEFVPEMARKIIENTETCTQQDLIKIAELHAKTINKKVKKADKLIFVDTDLTITSSYSKYLFSQELIVKDWVKSANQFDLYLYLDKDAPFIQDGTRLDKKERNMLDNYHRNELLKKDCNYKIIKGNWDERFKSSIKIIDEHFGIQPEDKKV